MTATAAFVSAPKQGREYVGSSTLGFYLHSTDVIGCKIRRNWRSTGLREAAVKGSLCSKYTKTIATHTTELNSKVKEFSLKINLIVFKLEMFCVSLQNHLQTKLSY